MNIFVKFFENFVITKLQISLDCFDYFETGHVCRKANLHYIMVFHGRKHNERILVVKKLNLNSLTECYLSLDLTTLLL